MTDLYFGLSVIYANKLLQSLLLYKNRYTTHLSSGEKNWGENKTSRMKDKGKRIHWITNWVRNISLPLAIRTDARVASSYMLISRTWIKKNECSLTPMGVRALGARMRENWNTPLTLFGYLLFHMLVSPYSSARRQSPMYYMPELVYFSLLLSPVQKSFIAPAVSADSHEQCQSKIGHKNLESILRLMTRI